jgi:hypothetical protein
MIEATVNLGGLKSPKVWIHLKVVRLACGTGLAVILMQTFHTLLLNSWCMQRPDGVTEICVSKCKEHFMNLNVMIPQNEVLLDALLC